MKANKALKRLAKIEALMSSVTERYSASAPHIREALEDAKAAITRAKEAVSLQTPSGTATKPPISEGCEEVGSRDCSTQRGGATSTDVGSRRTVDIVHRPSNQLFSICFFPTGAGPMFPQLSSVWSGWHGVHVVPANVAKPD